MGLREETIDAQRRRDVEHAAVRVLAEADTLDQAAPQILSGICRALDWSFGALWALDAEIGELRCRYIWHNGNPRLGPFEAVCRELTYPPGLGLPGRVWEIAAPTWIPDVAVDANFPRASSANEAGLHGAFGFPIFVRNEFYGVMEFFSAEVHEPDEDLLAMVSTIGIQIGDFIEWENLNSELSLQKALLESQGEAAPDGIMLVSRDQRVLHWNHRLAEMWDVPEEVLAKGDAFEVNTCMARKAADPRVFDEIADAIRTDPALERRDEIVLADRRVYDRWTAPALAPDGTPLGRTVYYRDITEQKRLEERLRRSQEWAAFLGEASLLLSETFDFEDGLRRLARLAVPKLADWCSIHMIDTNDVPSVVAVAHEDPAKVRVTREFEERYSADTSVETGIMGVVRSRTPVLYSEIGDDLLKRAARDKGHLIAMRALDVRSAMIVPLICRDRVLGTITFVSSDSGRTFTEDDLERAQELAARAAFPIDNARLYQQSAQTARTLQRSLLPPDLPTIPGLELSAHYIAAGEGIDVGGDFYDAFRTGRRSWGLVLGDVSGKGLEAATVTSLARHTIRGAAIATQRPSEILRILNTALLEQSQTDRLCTAVYAHVEPRFATARVTVCCAGHPLPYVVRSSGSIEAIQCGGTLLGFTDAIELRDVTVELDFGDKLFLYTDGVLDLRYRGGTFGEERLEELLRTTATRGTKSAAEHVSKTVLDLQNGKTRDDVALMVLGVRASIFRVRRRTLEDGSA